MINIKGTEIPNKVNELTVEQFDKLSTIDNELDKDHIEKWIEKFTYLGVPEETFDELTLEEFKQCIKDFNDFGELPTERQLSFELDGYEYIASDVISVKDLSLLEKKWKKDRSQYTADCLSVLFKRSDLSKTEHYEEAHMKHKKKLFKALKCELGIPHLMEVVKNFTQTVEELNETPAELERSNG